MSDHPEEWFRLINRSAFYLYAQVPYGDNGLTFAIQDAREFFPLPLTNAKVLFRWNNGGEPIKSSESIAINQSIRLFLTEDTTFFIAFANVPVVTDAEDRTLQQVINQRGNSIHADWPWSCGGRFGALAASLTVTPGRKRRFDWVFQSPGVHLRADRHSPYSTQVIDQQVEIEFDVEDELASEIGSGGSGGKGGAGIVRWKDPRVKVVGVEITQGVQHFWSEAGPDNSLPLIEGRTTCVRVFAESQRPEATSLQCVGTLTVLKNGQPLEVIQSLAPALVYPSHLTANRDHLAASINFLFTPTALELTLELTVVPIGTKDDSLRYRKDLQFEPSPPVINVAFARFSGFWSEDVDQAAFLTSSEAQFVTRSEDPIFPVENAVDQLFPVRDQPQRSGLALFPHAPVDIYGWRGLDEATRYDAELTSFDVATADWQNDPKMRFGLLPRNFSLAVGMSLLTAGLARDTKLGLWRGVAIAEEYAVSHEFGHLVGLKHTPGTSARARGDIGLPYPSLVEEIWETGINCQYLKQLGSQGQVSGDRLQWATRPGRVTARDLEINAADQSKALPAAIDFMNGGALALGWVTPFRWLQLLERLRRWPSL